MKLFDILSEQSLPEKVNIVPTVDVVAFPDMIIPLLVMDQRIINGIEDALKTEEKMILLLACRKQQNNVNVLGPEDLYSVGTVATIIRTIPLENGGIKVLVQGVDRVSVKSISVDNTLSALIEPFVMDEEESSTDDLEYKVLEVKQLVKSSADAGNTLSKDFYEILEKAQSVNQVAHYLLSHVSLSAEEAQAFLEVTSYTDFFNKISSYLVREAEVSDIHDRVKNRTRDSINSAQREFYVREQIKALKQELGEEENDSDEFRKKLKDLTLPEDVHSEILTNIERFDRLSQDSAESGVLRTYLECVLDLPWNSETIDNSDIVHAKEVLDKEHFGLYKIKDRILDFLSVRLVNAKNNGAILCFYGPSGVGKTSLAKSIAHALDRKFFRVSVGGLKDEAEIRGHRRTYVGAIPGRIMKGVRQVHSKNPVIVIDEVDKIGSDFRGDPASALLEVLDHNQNNEFYDHYISLPFDLSKALFILTANRLDTIPVALRDRLEVIEVSAYTQEEKKKIAQTYFVPSIIEECSLSEDEYLLNDDVLDSIITGYTCESGVRDLNRILKRLASRVVRLKLENGSVEKISKETLESLLGAPRFIKDDLSKVDRIGVVSGLSWTPYGGETIRIESVIMPGVGKLILTGQLGDVMKESAQAALSYIRARADMFGISADMFTSHDVHIHVPAGAIPKDGPSAGAAILTSLLSSFTHKPINGSCAMTGEIDLQGNVLPVGGIKEKVLAARRQGLNKVLLPVKNNHDVDEIKDLVSDIEVILTKHIDEVLSHMFEGVFGAQKAEEDLDVPVSAAVDLEEVVV